MTNKMKMIASATLFVILNTEASLANRLIDVTSLSSSDTGKLTVEEISSMNENQIKYISRKYRQYASTIALFSEYECSEKTKDICSNSISYYASNPNEVAGLITDEQGDRARELIDEITPKENSFDRARRLQREREEAERRVAQRENNSFEKTTAYLDIMGSCPSGLGNFLLSESGITNPSTYEIENIMKPSKVICECFVEVSDKSFLSDEVRSRHIVHLFESNLDMTQPGRMIDRMLMQNVGGVVLQSISSCATAIQTRLLVGE